MTPKIVAVLLLAATAVVVVLLVSRGGGPNTTSQSPQEDQHREASAVPPAPAPQAALPASPVAAKDGSPIGGASADPAAVDRMALDRMAELRALSDGATLGAAEARDRRQEMRQRRQMDALPDPEFWRLLKEQTWREALAFLAERLAGTHDEAWLHANAIGATVAVREAPPWEALNSLVDVFARVCSAAVPPRTPPPTPGHTIWRDRLYAGHFFYFEAALGEAVHCFDRRSHEGDFSEFLAVRVIALAGLVTDAQRADPAVRTLVEFVRLNAAIAYSEDTRREGAATTAVRLLPRIRTFIEADRGPATERVKPMVDWVRTWYPGALSVPVEDPPEGTPLPALREKANDHSPFARHP